MAFAGKLSTLALAFLLFGCKAVQPVSGSAAAAIASASQGQNQVLPIPDPTLGNQPAITVTIPAGWQFQSVLLQGGSCAPTPYGVFRATSPDGQSIVERMPTLAWQWAQGPMAAYQAKSDCLPLKGPMSAQQFLHYLAATMGLHYDSDQPVPGDENAKAQQQLASAQAAYAPQYAASNLQQPRQGRQLARAAVSATKGSVALSGILDAMVDCTETSYPGTPSVGSYNRIPSGRAGAGSVVDKCLASVTYYSAPSAQLPALMARWQAPGMGSAPVVAWEQAWIARNSQQSRNAINQWSANAAAQRQATAAQFQRSMAVQQQVHNQFMATLQAGTDASMARTGAAMNARTTAASDWVDYALDQKTVLNTNTGVVSKIPNQITPGGALQQVHGNGTPY